MYNANSILNDMNDYDRNNLLFILDLDETEFDEWVNSIPDDDVEYAIELVTIYRQELIQKEAMLLDEVPDTAVANEYLQKFRL